MRAVVVVILAVAAALIAPRLVVAPAQSHVPGAALPDCRAVLALPGELYALVAVGADAACGPAIVLMPSPLTLADMSAQAMAHIWAQPEPAPNERIAKAQRAIRQTYDRMMDGIEALAAPAQDPQAATTS